MNIGFVGVGRMGANMARRLKDGGFSWSPPFSPIRTAGRMPPPSRAELAGAAASQDLSEVSAESDVIITVVSDDRAMGPEVFGKATAITCWSKTPKEKFSSIAPRCRPSSC